MTVSRVGVPHTLPHSLAARPQKGAQDPILPRVPQLTNKEFLNTVPSTLEFGEGRLISQAFQQSEGHSPMGQHSDSGSGH